MLHMLSSFTFTLSACCARVRRGKEATLAHNQRALISWEMCGCVFTSPLCFHLSL